MMFVRFGCVIGSDVPIVEKKNQFGRLYRMVR